MIHQFTKDTVVNKHKVATREHLAISFNMDGFGSPAAKKSKYRMLAQDPRFSLGFKLFYHQDVAMLSPKEALQLEPPPAVIEYQ